MSHSQPWRTADNLPGDAADVAMLAAALRTVLGDFDAEHFRKALHLQGGLEKAATRLERWPQSAEEAEPWRWTPEASQAGVRQAEIPVSEQLERDTRRLLNVIGTSSRSRR